MLYALILDFMLKNVPGYSKDDVNEIKMNEGSMENRLLKNRIKVQRAIKDLTQEQLAQRVGVSRKTINNIEKGKYVPSGHLILKLAKEFKAPVEEIFQLSDDLDLKKENRINEINLADNFPLSSNSRKLF